MKKLSHVISIMVGALAFVQAANAQTTLLSDNFVVDANVSNPNYEIANGRQGGTQATSPYTYSGNVQVGHTGADFGQPGGAANGNFMLLAQNAWAYNNLGLNDALLQGGSLKVSFNLYTAYSGTSASDWLSFTIGAFGTTGNPWPVSNEFALIVRHNGALDIIDGATDVFSQGAGYVTTNAWTLIFSGADGTGSPFDGATRVSIYNGATLIDQFNMTNGLTPGIQLGFYAYNSMIGGVGNLSIQATPAPLLPLTARPFSMKVPYGGSASQTVVGIYTPFVDTNGGAVFIAGVTQGTNGMATFTGANLTYTSTNGSVADQFTYIVSDSLGEFATNTVTTEQLPPLVNIMPLGDSITWGDSNPNPVRGGYYYPLYQLLTNLNYNVHYVGTLNDNSPPGLTFNVEGHRGAQLGGVDALLPGVFSEVDDPDVILLLLGTNDYGEGNPGGATNRLDQIITDLATQRPHAKILVANLLVRNDDNGYYWSEITNQFNPYVPGIVAAHAALGQQVYFVDLSSQFSASGLSPDNLHPSATGYGTVANAWLPAITNVITPYGTTNPPAISHVVAPAGLTNLLVTFSKPMGTAATNISNYSLSGGLAILNASLDIATRRVVALTTSPQTPNASYILTVNGVTDFTPAASVIMPNSTAVFQASAIAGATNNVVEAAKYTLSYSLNIPNTANYSITNPLYSADNHTSIHRASRLAYYLELQASNGPLQYVWVSMDPFTTNMTKIGVPTLASGAVFQQNVTNMNIYSDVPGIVTGNGLSGGNIEFWPYNYVAANASGVPGANPNIYDFGDQNLGSGNYGSMQIANHNAGQMLMSLNQWGGNSTANIDLGIGNNLVYYQDNASQINALTDINTDWTFRGNGGNYVIKRLQVYVAVPNPVTIPVPIGYNAGTSLNIAISDLATNWTDVPGQSVTLSGVALTSTNGVTVSTNGSYIIYYNTNGVNDQISYQVIDTAGVTAAGVINLIAGAGGRVNSIAFTNGVASMTFVGISGYKYHVQISTNLTDWDDVMVTNAPADAMFQFADPNPPSPEAYYRLMWNGN